MSAGLHKITSKLKRLPTIGPKEAIGRIRHELGKHRERISYRSGMLDWSSDTWRRRLCGKFGGHVAGGELSRWWQQHMRTRQEPAFLLDATTLEGTVDLYHQMFADRIKQLIQQADRVCNGQFSFLGIDFRAEDPIAWQRDPQTGRSWPTKFYADVRIPFCDGTGSKGAPGDVKYVWELNRHEFLIDCAKAFSITGETRYARCVFEVIASWIEGNPYLQGVNWAGPLEVAVRSLSWLWAYQFCRRWEELSSSTHLKLIKSFYQHGTYLYRHLEIYSSPNNHLVGEATALYLLASFLPEFDESPVWLDRAWGILVAEPERQFYDDGGSTEQATSYHHYCLGFFLLAVLTRLRQSQPLPEAMLNRLELALCFSMWMTTPDGTVPRIGDTDDARSIHFTDMPLWDFRNLLSLGAIMFRRPDLKAVAGSYSEDALWLLGAQGYREFQELPAEVPSTTSRAFPSSGYAVMRSGWGPEDHHLCFDCGPIGSGLYTKDIPLFTHGHADMLSFTISAFGRPLLVDSGFLTYNGGPDWHRYCRDVQGHNTVSIDGQSQAKFNIANAWSCVAEPGPIFFDMDSKIEFAEGRHSGFYGTNPRVRHRRAILWDRSTYWVIRDCLEGEGTHGVEIFFHFSPGKVERLSERSGVSVRTETGVHALLQAFGADALEVDIKHGEAEPDGGWIATSYGQRAPAPLVKFHGHAALPFTVTFILSFLRSSSVESVIEPARVHRLIGDILPDALAV